MAETIIDKRGRKLTPVDYVPQRVLIDDRGRKLTPVNYTPVPIDEDVKDEQEKAKPAPTLDVSSDVIMGTQTQPRSSYAVSTSRGEDILLGESRPTEPKRSFFDNIVESAKRGDTGVDINRQVGRAILSGGALQDYETPIKRRKEYLETVGEDPIIPSNIASETIYGVAEMLPPMAESATQGMGLGLAAAGVAAVAAAPTGPGEAAAIPAAYAFGQTAGTGLFWLEEGAGELYFSMTDAGVDHNIASAAAAIGSIPYALFEASQIQRLIPKVGKQAIKRKFIDSLVKKITRAGVNWAKDTGFQVTQEMAQEQVLAATEETSKFVHNLLKENKVERTPIVEAAERILEVGVKSIGPMGLLTGLSHGAGGTLNNISALSEVENPTRKNVADALGVDPNKLPPELRAAKARADAVNAAKRVVEVIALPPEPRTATEQTGAESAVAEQSAEGIAAPEEPASRSTIKKLWDNSAGAAIDLVSAVSKKPIVPINEKKDLRRIGRYLGSPEFTVAESGIVGAEKVHKAAQDTELLLRDLQHKTYNISGQDDAPSEIAVYKKSKTKRSVDYIVETDKLRGGYRAVLAEDGIWYTEAPYGVRQQSSEQTEEGAWQEAFLSESRKLLGSGYSEKEARAVLAHRNINRRNFILMKENLDALIQQHESATGSSPVVEVMGKKMPLQDAVKALGDLSGSFMARLRGEGRYLLWATRGEESFMKPFKTKKGASFAEKRLRREGYTIDKLEIANKPVRDKKKLPTQISDVARLDNIIKAAEKNINKTQGQVTNLEELGIDATYNTYTRKGGTQEQHLIIKPKQGVKISPPAAQILKDLGGGWYDDNQTGIGEAWHFVNPSPDIEKEILKGLAENQVAQHEVKVLTEILAPEIAKVINSLSVAGARKIARSGAIGEEVVTGYKTDPYEATVKVADAIIRSTTKAVTARKIMNAILGKTVSQEEFNAMNPLPEGLSPEESQNAEKLRRKVYKQMVERDRLDSALQPEAYKEAISIADEVLRERTKLEAAFGTLKELTAIKYISGAAVGFVNYLTLITNAPPEMALLGIPKHRIPTALSAAFAKYPKYYAWNKFGVGETPSHQDVKLYDEVIKQGMVNFSLNYDAINALKGKLGKAGDASVDAAMAILAISENHIRGATIVAIFNELKRLEMKKKGVEWNEGLFQDVLGRAYNASNRIHGDYRRASYPPAARGGSAAAIAFRSWYTFMKFPHVTLQLIERSLGKKAVIPAAWLLLTPMIAGGAPVSPLHTLLIAIYKYLGRAIPGFKKHADPEYALYLYIKESQGKGAAEFYRTGVFGLCGIDVSNSLKIFATGFPTTLMEALGAPASFINDEFQGAVKIMKGDVDKGLEQMSPRIVAGFLRANRERREGVSRASNKPVLNPDGTAIKPNSTYDTILRIIGLSPSSISSQLYELGGEKRVKAYYDRRRRAFYAKVRNHVMAGTYYRKDIMLELFADQQEFNADIRRDKWPFKIPEITKKQIDKAAKEARGDKK